MQRDGRAARGITAVVGFIDCDSSARNDHGTIRKYNAAAVVRDGRVLQRARKSLLPNYRYFDDKRFFTPARAARAGRPRRSAAGASRVGVSICEDMWDDYYDVKPLPELAAQGAAVLLNINASPFYPGKRHERDALIRRHIDALRAADRLRQHRRRGRQRQEHHPVRRREPGLRRGGPADRRWAASSRRTC